MARMKKLGSFLFWMSFLLLLCLLIVFSELHYLKNRRGLIDESDDLGSPLFFSRKDALREPILRFEDPAKRETLLSIHRSSVSDSNSPDSQTSQDSSEHAKPDSEPRKTEVSDLVFGIASSVSTWTRRRDFIKAWWSADIVGRVWLDAPLNAVSIDDPPFEVSSDFSHLRYTGTGIRDFVRISRIIKDLFRLGFNKTRWFVMGDDDTFFNPKGLAALLSKYDHNQMMYIGGKSESHWQNHVVSQEMAFGGGGYAISQPLAAALNHSLDECLQKYPEIWGSDQRISVCVAELGVHFTWERGFHQLDVHGSAFGILMSHPPHVFASLHHLELIEPLLPLSNKAVALQHLVGSMDIDPVGFLQQTFCYDNWKGLEWTTSISWGYAIKIYPNIVRSAELYKVERTFPTFTGHWDPSAYDFDTREFLTPSSDPCGLPIVMFCVSSRRLDGSIETVYTRVGLNLTRERDLTKCKNLPSKLRALKVIKDSPSKVPESRIGKFVGPNLDRLCCEPVESHARATWLGTLRLKSCE